MKKSTFCATNLGGPTFCIPDYYVCAVVSTQSHTQGALRILKSDSDAPQPGRWVLQPVPRPISPITISSLADRCIWWRGRTSRMSGTSPPVPVSRSQFTAFRTGTPPS